MKVTSDAQTYQAELQGLSPIMIQAAQKHTKASCHYLYRSITSFGFGYQCV